MATFSFTSQSDGKGLVYEFQGFKPDPERSDETFAFTGTLVLHDGTEIAVFADGGNAPYRYKLGKGEKANPKNRDANGCRDLVERICGEKLTAMGYAANPPMIGDKVDWIAILINSMVGQWMKSQPAVVINRAALKRGKLALVSDTTLVHFPKTEMSSEAVQLSIAAMLSVSPDAVVIINDLKTPGERGEALMKGLRNLVAADIAAAEAAEADEDQPAQPETARTPSRRATAKA